MEANATKEMNSTLGFCGGKPVDHCSSCRRSDSNGPCRTGRESSCCYCQVQGSSPKQCENSPDPTNKGIFECRTQGPCQIYNSEQQQAANDPHEEVHSLSLGATFAQKYNLDDAWAKRYAQALKTIANHHGLKINNAA